MGCIWYSKFDMETFFHWVWTMIFRQLCHAWTLEMAHLESTPCWSQGLCPQKWQKRGEAWRRSGAAGGEGPEDPTGAVCGWPDWGRKKNRVPRVAFLEGRTRANMMVIYLLMTLNGVDLCWSILICFVLFSWLLLVVFAIRLQGTVSYDGQHDPKQQSQGKRLVAMHTTDRLKWPWRTRASCCLSADGLVVTPGDLPSGKLT